MLFFAHLLLFCHGLLGLLVTKIRVTSVVGDVYANGLLPVNVIEFCNKVWPDSATSVFRTMKPHTEELEPDPKQAYMVCAAEMAYSVWFLFNRHKPKS